MRLLKYLVTDFRSVENSGWIDADSATALVGVNESGKTNLLLPLWKLNPAREGKLEPTSDYPKKKFAEIRSNPGNYRFIRAQFDTEELAGKLAELTKADLAALSVVTVDRYFDGKHQISFPNHVQERDLDPTVVKEVLAHATEEINALVTLKAEEKLKADLLDKFNAFQLSISTGYRVNADQIHRFREEISALVPTPPAKTSTIVPRVELVLEWLANQHAKLVAPPLEKAEGVEKAVLDALPKFVYYSNYGNLDSEIYLPHIVQNLERTDLGEKEAAKARTLRVLFKFVGLQPKEVLELGRDFKDPGNPGREPTQAEIEAIADKKRQRSILLQSASATLTTKFKEWWKQGDYRFRFEADGNHFRIWVSDDRRPEEVELESRSTGLQWFLSFYLVFLVESEGGEHQSAVLLLDEPGLSLHPLAQRDLSAFFEGLARTNQLVYTTHSPFLVDADRLERARKVYVSENGTTKITANLRHGEGQASQAGAAYAVHSALNLSVAESLLLGCQPIIVEGTSDQLYLSTIKTLLIGAEKIAPKRELVFPPSGGTKTARVVASILTGRDEKLPVMLLDGDESGKRMAKELRSSLYATHANKLITLDSVLEFDGAEVEDLFPGAFIAQVVDRWERRPEEPFSDVFQPKQPLVNQVESWAKKHGVILIEGWKVELAKRVKQYAISKGIAAFDDDTILLWTKLFNALIAADAGE
ncbi:MAG TPA: AAA family ATPase [Noviherbaspirillum sp.]|uniref:AAA family ATPase n=1 Tax=Noviherbaspirillum sp. TaxID=1926288 RepID=UPI002B4A5B8C|nr:AAA family ATPase [Noviherbaspirillum sp.]HJV86075.1 AAA family ATPase [Noviherbaspirillum sp.]